MSVEFDRDYEHPDFGTPLDPTYDLYINFPNELVAVRVLWS